MTKKTKNKKQSERKPDAHDMLYLLACTAFDCCLNVNKQLAEDFESNGDVTWRWFIFAFMIGFMECNRIDRDAAYDENDRLKPLTPNDLKGLS
ncbi:MAG: hypothetical protein FWD31_15205 [Planctomycetaceae bacterium]|nr:hypothetical protein [Planctomycetaceae bacterium]